MYLLHFVFYSVSSITRGEDVTPRKASDAGCFISLKKSISVINTFYLVRLSSCIFPEYKHLDVNIFIISSNENTVIYDLF